MILTGMKIEGYKNINFVELVPDSHMNLVSGKNGAGKSSLIEAMIDAIKGKTEMGKHPQKKIKNGKDKAVIEVTLGEGKDALNIKRTITQKGVYLKAERADGKPVSQGDLDKLLDSSTINITKLLHLDPKGQIDFVKRVAGIDTAELENEYKELYGERTVLNRAAKEAKGALSSYGDIEEVEYVNISGLLKKIEEADAINRNIMEEESEIEALENSIVIDDEAIEKAKATIEICKQTIEGREKAKKENAKEAKKRRSNIQEKIDTVSIRAKVSDAEEINGRAKKYDMYLESTKASDAASAKAKEVDDKMASILQQREDLINNSKLPFKNVEFDKDLGLVIGGIPFSEMSSAQQIKTMSRIYIESDPKLKVIYVKDGSLLDRETLAQIVGMSELKDYQFLVEIVSEVEGSIVMREGSIVGNEQVDNREEL